MNFSIGNVMMIIFFVIIVGYVFSSTRVQQLFSGLQSQIAGTNSILAGMPAEYVLLIGSIILILVVVVIFSFLK